MPTRNASAVWEGGLKGGTGRFRGESGKIEAPYSFGTRFGTTAGTNPEELLAAAEAACFSMALGAGLEGGGTPATRIETKVAVTVDKVGEGFEITSMKLQVRATVPGVDAATFKKAAETAKKGCPVSKALAGIKTVDMDAALA